MGHPPTPPHPVRKIRSAARTFLAHEATSGIILMAAAALALIIANSPLAETYWHTLHLATGAVLAPAIGPMPAQLWINDGLRAIFFLFVGLEIKHEIVATLQNKVKIGVLAGSTLATIAGYAVLQLSPTKVRDA